MTEQELNEKHNIHQVIQEAMRTAHYEPSPETKTRLKSLEDNQNKIVDKLDHLEEKLDQIKLDITALPEKIFDKADNRYASKLSERVMYSMVGAIVLAFLYAMLNNVIK